MVVQSWGGRIPVGHHHQAHSSTMAYLEGEEPHALSTSLSCGVKKDLGFNEIYWDRCHMERMV